MQRQLIRSIDRLNLDVSGNISSFKRVRDCELENKYLRLFDLFSEVKVCRMVVTFVPSTAIRNATLALASLFAGVAHEDLTSLQSLGDQVINIPNVKMHCMANPKPITKTWNITPGDADEETFYNAGGTSIGRIIPASLGGVFFWSDGPVTQAGVYVGDLYTEWHLLYRGMRND
jgi:hypothetical protein